MSQQFSVTYDDCGNISVRSGWVISKGLADIRVGPAESSRLAAPVTGDLPAAESGGNTYLGGSGRNLILSGFPNPAYNGPWRHGYPGKWSRGDLTLTQVPGGATTIAADYGGALAERASGGPLGTLTSTTDGASTFGAAFTVTVAAEWSAPGVISKADMVSGAKGLRPMDFTATDVAHYVSTQDPRFTIDIAEGGEACLRYSGVIIASRDDGPNDSAEGEYVSTADGMIWNPTPPPESDVYVEPPAVNPFGILTVVYSWPAVPDLDTGTRFLGKQVGYGYGSSEFMSWSGDDQSPSGSETVVIDLASAWAAGAISQSADVDCIADWFPEGSYGPASLNVTYSLPGFTPLAITIQPGYFHGGAKTVVTSLHIGADGSVGRYYERWVATLTRRRVPPPAGIVYIQEVSAGGVFTSIAGPTFAATRPADSATKYCIPLAISDGLGQVEAIWTGSILRR
jgi:hypothetical protein